MKKQNDAPQENSKEPITARRGLPVLYIIIPCYNEQEGRFP